MYRKNYYYEKYFRQIYKKSRSILCLIIFSYKSCRLWGNVEKYCPAGDVSEGNITRPTRFVCWVIKATETQSECVIFLAFPRQESLRERAFKLRYTYIWSPLHEWTHQSIYNLYGSLCGSQGMSEKRGERPRLCTKAHLRATTWC